MSLLPQKLPQKLPQEIDSATYWRDVYKQPLPFWQQALQTIVAVHQLPAQQWSRAALGRNIVFLSPTVVVKLGPPMWPGEMPREVAALQFVAGRLPVTTPRLLATGTLGGWDYLVQERLPGTNLRDLWPDLDDQVRARVAHQHGELMAAIHSLPLHDAPADLHFDWAAMLAEQHECCARDMREAGVVMALVDQVDAYLAATPWSIEQGESALVHGDLDRLNFLASEIDGVWEITGVVDWGDVKIGPPSHEFISPGIHMYRDNRAELLRWYQGYALLRPERAATYQHVIMARAMLYYPDSFADFIQKIPGAASCSDWTAMASAFWLMDMA
jgi:hygromycin-B 7''-O-kinase